MQFELGCVLLLDHLLHELLEYKANQNVVNLFLDLLLVIDLVFLIVLCTLLLLLVVIEELIVEFVPHYLQEHSYLHAEPQ